MSDQEASPLSPLPLNAETKLKPGIPPKPSGQPSSPPRGSRRLSEGKVKSIVNKFSKQGYAVNEPAEQPASGTAEVAPSKRLKQPPTVKPKPRSGSLSSQVGGGQAPPLPKKMSRKPKGSETSDEVDGISVEGGRSAPDGKEVEVHLTGGGEAEAEHSPHVPLSPSCEPSCSCVCHLQWPGMKLVWVPADDLGEEGGGDEEDEIVEEEEDGGAGDSEGLTEVGSPTANNEGELLKKAKFHQSLNVLLGEGHRRLSDPGPASLLALAVACSHSPPIPPKHPQSAQMHHEPAENEEESIYEVTLPVLQPCPKINAAPAFKEAGIPTIKVRKPARRSKLTYSPSDPMSEFQDIAELSSSESAPPTIPPRMPLSHDSQGLAPVLRGGVPLPQPTPEERRALLPSSLNSAAGGRPSGQRAITPPPVLPVRPPPPPPKTDSRRLSNVSLLSLTQSKDGEQNGENEAEKDDAVDEARPVGKDSLERQSSFSFESRLRDEPLYQTYRATVINKEICRQTVCRNISKTSVDFTMDWAARRSGAGGGTATGTTAQRGSPVPTPGQSTLWQELPAVRDSGILEQLSPEQCKYQESMFEVLTSEASYFRSLRVLTEHFLESRDLENTIVIMDRKNLFSNIMKIREVSERFLKDLEDRIFGELVFPDICDIIHYHAQHNFPAYVDYVRNQIYQEKTYTSLIKSNGHFARVLTRLQESPQCQRLPFMSFLLLPFQRIARIKMLIENILKRTKERTKEEQTASKALYSVSKIMDECNTEVGKMRQMEELVYISDTLEFDKMKKVAIVSQTRHLEKKGELHEMSKAGTLFNMRAKFIPVYLFLFNDLLLITTKKGAERFVVLDHAHRSLVQVQSLDAESSPCEHCFTLTLLENHQGRSVERLFKAPSQSDMDRWMAAFPNPTNPDRYEDEVIYEDWGEDCGDTAARVLHSRSFLHGRVCASDCPQVQCVEQYIAQQTDELALEPTEIINVIRKTNEGFYEGIRLSDGQKGWFPAANVIEITNEHVRRRNLRERYRVMQAAAAVAYSKSGTVN